MTFEILLCTPRKVTIELIDAGIYFTEKPYTVLLDGEPVLQAQKAVVTLRGLLPDTKHTLQVICEDGEASQVQSFHTPGEFVTLDVRRFGARGDGIQDDTVYIQTAILCCPENSRVYLPKGNYRVHCLFLRSNMTLELHPEAVISAIPQREGLPILPGLTQSWDEESEYNLGTWEGNPQDMFAGIITGVNVHNVTITGGTVDGGASRENWWQDGGRMKIGGGFRPRLVFLNHCSDVTVHDVTFQNSPAWTLHPYFSDHTRWIDLEIRNPMDSPNTDGMDPESVEDLLAVGLHFSVGDDCVAVKSGKYYMGHRYQKPSRNLEFRQCFMEHGHGALTLGSEISAGVLNLRCHDCLFSKTDRGLRVKTRRGRGKDCVVDDVEFERLRMDHVKSPLVVNSFYNCCDPDAHTAYVSCKDPLPVDDRTPAVRRLVFRDIIAENCHAAACFLYGLPEAPIESVIMENVSFSFSENPVPAVPAMMDGEGPRVREGIMICNCRDVTLNQVTVEGAEGEPVRLLGVAHAEGSSVPKE